MHDDISRSARKQHKWWNWAFLAIIPILLSACSALSPKSVTLPERLAMFPTDALPLEQPVTVRWNSTGVPWIEAGTDRDLAFTLGLVHAHLRLGQISVMRRVVQGRLSESAGPFMNDLDRTLRTIDFGYAAADIEAQMPPATRTWLQAFVDGLNWYQTHAKKRPPEFGLLALEDEPWTIRDLIAIGRLAGTDVNWLVYPSMLKARLAPDWPETWQRALAAGTDSTPSFAANEQQAMLFNLLAGSSRSGSDSLAVAPSHSASGAALLASDPHLGMTLPNFWLLIGVKSPSYHAVGLMPPGVPVMGLGRNEDIAWGGTNMRAASSELYDVSGEPGIVTRQESIHTRLWFDNEVTIRRAKEGPIVSDLPAFPGRPGETIALRWKGYEPSDEFSAFLGVMRAKSVDDFREALASYGVGGQNMICATRSGEICQVTAAHLPVRDPALPADLVRKPGDPAAAWHGEANAMTLPFVHNPPGGLLASANNRPAPTSFPLGFFYSGSERVERLYALLRAKDKLSIADLARLQQDTLSLSSLALKQALLPMIASSAAAKTAPAFVEQLRSWDGRYDADRTGPVVFETLLYELTKRLYANKDGVVPGVNADWNYLIHYLPQDLAACPAAEREALIDAAVTAAAATSSKYANWGEIHRLQVGHMLAAVPVVGGPFVLEDFGVGGSRNTIMKTSHGLVNGRHYVTYGSQARQLCDMSDPDHNQFVLFGGEDGWLGSANYADQIALWRQGRTIPMPLTPAKVEAEFPTRLTLTPQVRAP